MIGKKWDVYLMGVLAEDEYVESLTGKYKSVFINTQNAVQFSIQMISSPPYGFPNEKLFTSFSTELERYGYQDDYYEPPHIREYNLRNFLQDYLIIFQPQRKIRPNHDDIYQATEIKLVRKAEGYKLTDSLLSVPIFSSREHGFTYEEFLKRLESGRFVGKIDYISIEADDTPPFILWKHEDGSLDIIGEFDKHQHAHGGFSFHYQEGLRLASLPDEWLDEMYEVSSTLLFINLDTYKKMEERLSDEGALELSSLLKETQKEEVAVSLATADPVKPTVSLEQTVPSLPAHIDATGEAGEEKQADQEMQFMARFAQVTRESGLLYEEKNLLNFHTAMKVSNLVILQGMSGTGKSRLVQAYGKALGIREPQLTIIPVRPAWSDDADLVGYVDSLHMVYRPGDSGLINVLKNAEDNKNKLYVVCFDEMNLARVEHYFSQFLSVLEMEPNRRYLRLYNDDLESRLYNSAQYPPTIQIGENVMFVGTVNMDESTYHFSDKVLDRANVITLDVCPYSQLKELKEDKKKADHVTRPLEALEFEHFRNKQDSIQLKDRELELLWEIHQEMQLVNKNLGVGPRIVRQIDLYMKNLPGTEPLSKEEAFDLQVVQRVLTKLRGSEDMLDAFIGKFDLRTGEWKSGKLVEILDRYADIGSFDQTRKVLQYKAKELKVNGYTF